MAGSSRQEILAGLPIIDYQQRKATRSEVRTMAVQCEVCGKRPEYGHNVSHAKNHTPRRWVPNIQVKRVLVGGELVRLKICTRCLRTLSKSERVG